MTSAKIQGMDEPFKGADLRIPTPFASAYPETPLTANPLSPNMPMEMSFPSAMTATPPLSAGAVDGNGSQTFTFAAMDTEVAKKTLRVVTVTGPSPKSPRPRINNNIRAPYTHPRSLRSILRNSPLPPNSARTPISPRRQSLRLAEKAARRVGYNSPLTQTITTQLYTKSHIDLLAEEASPYSPSNPPSEDNPEQLHGLALDLTTAYSGDETRDGGQTPGPFEDMRRRIASLDTETPTAATAGGRSGTAGKGIGSPNDKDAASTPKSGALRKRKRRDRRHRWVWTIGTEDGDEADDSATAITTATPNNITNATADATAIAAIRRAMQDSAGCTPHTPAVRVHSAADDAAMSDASSVVSVTRATTPGDGDGDLDMRTPTVHGGFVRVDTAAPARTVVETVERDQGGDRMEVLATIDEEPDGIDRSRLSSCDLINPETGSRRDTPVPPDMLPPGYNDD